MSGKVGDLSVEQKETLEQFRVLVADVIQPHHDDYFLLRWLRANKFNTENAKTALLKDLAWRKKWKMDTLLQDYEEPELYKKYFPGGHLGFDKEGSPVRYVPFASYAFDLEGGMKLNTITGHLRHVSYLMEQDLQYARENSQRTGKVVELQSYIIDAKDCSYRLAWNKKALRTIYKVILMVENHYPERLKKVYIINFTPFLMILYNLGKTYINPELFRKFDIYSTEFQEALLNDIDADVLPAFLGGTRVDPDGDPRCPSVLRPGGIIDPKYYLMSPRCEFLGNKDVKVVVVDAKSEELVEVGVAQPDTLIQCEFLTDYYDIGFGIKYKLPGSIGVEQLVEAERVEYSDDPVKKEFHCKKPGIYILQFDNTYSWFRQKEVKYRIEVTSLENDPEQAVEVQDNYQLEVSASAS